MEQQQMKQKKMPRYLEMAIDYYDYIVLVTIIATVLALIGIVLGAVNYVAGPIHYPAWLLVVWFVVDLLLIVHVVVQGLFYCGIPEIQACADGAVVAGVIIGDSSFLVVGAILLGDQHFAWISLFAFSLLVTSLIIDVFFLPTWLDRLKEKSAEEEE